MTYAHCKSHMKNTNCLGTHISFNRKESLRRLERNGTQYNLFSIRKINSSKYGESELLGTTV
jgi:hypothetical protein